jgi:hypothetical protein
MSIIRKAALGAAALMVLAPAAAMADSHDGNAEVVVVHGVPGLEVDVLVNGEAAIEGFNFGDTVTTELPAGDYELAVAAAGTTDAILTADASVEAGVSYTVAAYLQEGGEPTLGAFANETDGTGIQPFHLADFGAVSIIAGGEIALDDVTNGVTARIDVPGGTTVEGVGIGVAGSNEAAIDLGDVEVPEDTLVLAYAIGPDEGEELPTVVVATVAAAGADDTDDGADNGTDDTTDDTQDDADENGTPTAVHSGTGGLAADQGMPVWVAALMMLGTLGLAAPAVAAARRRS